MLFVGKYLNVVCECGGVDVSKVVEDVLVIFDDVCFFDNVINVYVYVNEFFM